MNKKSLQELEKEYILGLNYIEHSNNAKSLKEIYVNRLKEIKNQIQSNNTEVQKIKRK